MPRTKLLERKMYEFRSTMEIQPRDINYGGHLAYDALVSLVGTARAHVFHSIGLSELDLGDGRTGVVMSDLVVNYRSEAFLFDLLLIDTHIDEITHTGFRLFHRISSSDKLTALVETGFVAFDYILRKVAPVPHTFIEASCRTTADR